jgi:hypothetical protein
VLWSTYIDPKLVPADRRWQTFTVDLSAHQGRRVALIFETHAGPEGDHRFDWAGWAAPQLLASRRGL